MENKSLFSSILLTVILISGYFFYNEKVVKLESELKITTQEYNQKLEVLQHTNPDVSKEIQKISTQNQIEASTQKYPKTSKQTTLKPLNISMQGSTEILEFDDLNNQLIATRAKLKETQKKLILANSKTFVLDDEMAQIKDSRVVVKTLKKSLVSAEKSLASTKKSLISTEKKLDVSDKKVDHLENIFKTLNSKTVKNNIERIKTLKRTSGAITISSLIVPVVGFATLMSYTAEEVDNYCANIKNTIALENEIFGKIVSLDNQAQQNYHSECVASIKDKIKSVLK